MYDSMIEYKLRIKRLIKGGKYIEEMSKIDTIAFDKTGTLTEGIIEVKDILSFDSAIENWFGIVFGLELLSEHPISKAIIFEAKKSPPPVCKIISNGFPLKCCIALTMSLWSPVVIISGKNPVVECLISRICLFVLFLYIIRYTLTNKSPKPDMNILIII